MTLLAFAFMILVSSVLGYLGLKLWFSSPSLSLYQVWKGNSGEDKKGIPFFVKKRRYVHRTAYLERLLLVRVVGRERRDDGQSKTPSELGSGSRLVRWPAAFGEVKKLETKLDQVDSLVAWRTALNQLRDLPSHHARPLDPEKDLTLESNEVVEETYVDYAEPYWINIKQPRSGKASATIELGDDGTLSKADTEVSDTTLEKLTGLLPVEKIVESFSPPSVTAEAVLDAATLPVEVIFEKQVITVRHIFEVPLDDPPTKSSHPEPYRPKRGLKELDRKYKRELVSDATPKAKPEPKQKSEPKSKSKPDPGGDQKKAPAPR